MSHSALSELRDTVPTGEQPAKGAGHSPAASGRIPEIDGLRGVAIALIVIYHIWLNRVSGGVDVFFLLSGFLITASLMRSVDGRGRIPFPSFYARICRRIFPPALLALVGIVVATIMWLPQSRWREVLADVIAAAGYVVNWRLAENAVDYLASQYAASPVQHYWSLAVQAQFYLVWPLVVAAAGFLALRLALRPRRVLATLLIAVFVLSLGYSIYRTATAQTYTYFDTFARLWEFSLGGLLLLALPHVRLSRSSKLVLGWLGLAALAACGLVFRGGTQFPGWAALWPTLAAVLIILSAGAGGSIGADRLLRSEPLRRLGDLSYALYLWHWPVLICYFAVAGRTTASLRGGVLIILASLVMAIATKWLAEDRLRASGIGQQTNRGSFALAAGALVTVLLATAGWTGWMHQEQQQRDRASANGAEWTAGEEQPDRALGPYPGAAHIAFGGDLADVPYQPGPLEARDDSARALYPGCHQGQEDSEPILCSHGPEDADRTIAVVGGSRAEHWVPAMVALAEQHDWRVVAITKSGCLFTDAEQYESCMEWNEKVVDELARMKPDAVFTTATRVPRDKEITPNGYIEKWQLLDNMGVPVLGVRDVPRPLKDVPDCVETHEPRIANCGNDAMFYGLDKAPTVATNPDLPDNVSVIDLTEFFCVSGFCPVIIGNVLVYYDNSHITATYAETVAPFLGEEILAATGW